MSGFAISAEPLRKHKLVLWLALIAAGLAGNYYKYPLFPDIDFLFGSIFALLAFQRFGLAPGIVAAALVASATYFTWNHPYAIVIMTAEMAVVAWLVQGRKFGLVLADTLYWLVLGIPLVWFFYHVVMQATLANTEVTLIKQALNGIANALVARLIFIGFSMRSGASQTSFRELIYNLMAFFVLCPTLILLALGGRADFHETDLRIRASLKRENQVAAEMLSSWLSNRRSSVASLADIAAAQSPRQMQRYLEQTQKSDSNFLRLGLLDKDAITIAYSPMFDELGQNNIGKDFADRFYLPTLKQTLRPMLTDVFMARIGTPKPIVMIIAPVLVQGDFGGFTVGVLNLDQIGNQLSQLSRGDSTLYTLLDKHNQVILTNRLDQTVMQPYARGQGRLERLDGELSQWVPQALANTPISERWKNSLYVLESNLGDLAEWKLVLEQPVVPYQTALFANYAGKLTLLFLILLASLALAEILSRGTVRVLDQLSAISRKLTLQPVELGQDIAWPRSSILQTRQLIENFKAMSASLIRQFQEIQSINASLEQRVQERTEALQRSSDLLRGSIEAIDEAFVLYDADDRLVFCNEKYRQIYASAAHLMVPGVKFETLLRANAQSGLFTDAKGRVEEWVAERLATHLASNSTLIQKHENGRTLRIIERRLPDGHIVGFRIDITDLVRATHDAQAANVAKSRFLATMSHEIRTPMNGILGMAQLLLMPDLSDDERRDYARTILACGQTLLTLLNDILDLSKIEAGKLQLEATVFQAESILFETQSLFAGAAQAKNLQLECHWDGSRGQRYKADAHRLRQMLSNLVGNAIKFTPGGEVRMDAAEIERTEHGAVLEFSVTDSGVGIAADKIDALFQPFSQADSSTTRQFGGSGLGLSIVSQLAQAMGGEAGVESVSGQGSRFWFRVRVNVPAEGEEARRLSRQGDVLVPTAAPALALSGRVLVAEDNTVNRMFIKALLRKLGLQVVTARDGQQALDAITRGDAPDAVLMDLNMPVMDGYAATVAIRQWEAENGRGRLPIIALTADAFEEDRRHCLVVGMDDFLTKPVVAQTLRATLEKWLPQTSNRAHETPLAVAQKRLDRAQFLALVSELTPLLEKNKFDAIARFKKLQALVQGTALKTEIAALEALLEELRFDRVLERLHAIAATQTEEDSA